MAESPKTSLSPSPLPSTSTQRAYNTRELVKDPLWQTFSELLPYDDRVKLSYDRARALAQHYRLSAEDVLGLTDKFWDMHADPCLAIDGAAGILLTTQYKVCIGTLLKYIKHRPDLQPTIDKLLAFEYSGQHCLTELAHGSNSINMETRATLLPDGSFDLHTPHDGAAKFMPPTAPSGMPCVAIVHARLFVSGEDRGPKVFLVDIHDGRNMALGVVSKVLSPRGSARPAQHCLTYFDHVHLPASALLSGLDKPNVLQEAFFDNISRIITGTITVAVIGNTTNRVASYIAAKYSLRRHVIDPSTDKPRPIISFSTQFTPILSAIAQSLVLGCFLDQCKTLFAESKSQTDKHFIGTIAKVTVMRANHAMILELGDRCGAQGLAEVNQLSALYADSRGYAIAEGDILVISIRFAIELLRGKVSVPPYLYQNSLLARHERSLISSLRKLLASSLNHRDQSVDTNVIPHCQTLIESIGARMAYEFAKGIIQDDILDLFVATAVQRDPTWFALNEGLDGPTQSRMEVEAAMKLLPRIEELLKMLDVEPYIIAPMVSDEKWDDYVNQLEAYGRDGVCLVSKL